MNKMKLAFKKLRDYLGRDTAGIALLQNAESLSDEFRKENAKLREEIESAKKQAEAAIVRRLSSDQQLQEERELRLASEAKMNQAIATIERLKKELQPPQAGDAKEPLNTKSAVLRQAKILKCSGFKWPGVYLIRDAEKAYGEKLPDTCTDVADVIKNWSGQELLKLGRFVALRTVALKGMAILFSSQKMTVDKKNDSNEYGDLWYMLEGALSLEKEYEEQSRFVGSKAEPPRLNVGKT